MHQVQEETELEDQAAEVDHGMEQWGFQPDNDACLAGSTSNQLQSN